MKDLDLDHLGYPKKRYFYKALILIRSTNLIMFPKISPAKYASDTQVQYLFLRKMSLNYLLDSYHKY